MFMLLFGFIGLMLDLALSLGWAVLKMALYLSPIFLLMALFSRRSNY